MDLPNGIAKKYALLHHPQDIKAETENLGHITNIWNIKQYRTKLPLSTFSVELKPAPNNKDIFNVENIQQCKIKFEVPKHKRDIAQCANCQRYGYTKIIVISNRDSGDVLVTT
jgi:hypothetical protein